MKQQQTLFFAALTAFSHMGGIEKFNRALMQAFERLSPELRLRCSYAVLYDTNVQEQYVPAAKFRYFNGRKLWFVVSAIIKGWRHDVVVLGHLNLAVIGVCIKFLAPRKKLIVICHGIEVFEEVSGMKKRVLHKADLLLAVSQYTKDQLTQKQGLPAGKTTVFPNTIDPFFHLPEQFNKPAYLQQRYGIAAGEKIIFTLTRLNHSEGYKGYDTLVQVLPDLIKRQISFKYILAGKADAAELQRMQQLIATHRLEGTVLMPGFIPDEEITDHYLLADVFAMPSKGEGFGIVYIEAMACGLAVIAGNKDGSTEALQFGQLGTLVDPDNKAEIAAAVTAVLQQQPSPQQIQQKMLHYFSFDQFQERLKAVLAAV